jgi:sigma-B regulation protein RsbU (phosphoserine phosphatase)
MPSETEQLRNTLKVYKGLVEVSALINAITDFNELLAALLDVARRVMLAEASSLFLTNADGNLELVIARNSSGEIDRANFVIPRGQGIAGWVLKSGKSELVADAYADPRFYAEADKKSGFRTRSILCAPLAHNGTEIGVLQVLNPLEKNAFDAGDLEAFDAYATLAATAIDKLRSIDRQREQARVQQELSVANEIQNSFLPQSLPSVAALDCAASYSPARNIGGDFYDVRETGPDEIHFVIGDVSGKGIPAALLMAQALSTLRLILRPGTAPADALARWNGMLCGHTIRGMFITATVGRIIPSRRLVEIASAGHCTPFLVGAKAGEAREMKIATAPPVGILPGLQYPPTTATMQTGEMLVFYTDGLTESFNAAREMLGGEGVLRILQQRNFSSAAGLVAALQQGEAVHRLAADPHDDLTILAFGFR